MKNWALLIFVILSNHIGIMVSVRPLSPELAEKARIELNEDPKRIEGDIAHLKDWIAKQPHLRARTDDQWLLSFLRGCKFSLERAKEKIDLYYSMRNIIPELFQLTHKDDKFWEIHNLGVQLFLPKTASPTAPRVSIIRPGLLDPSKYKMLDSISINYAIQQIVQQDDDQLMVCGVVSIMDMAGVTMAHLTQMTPNLMRKMVVAGQDANPIRMKGFHYLNTPPGFETFFNFVKGLLNEKNRKRIFVHNKDYEAMYEHIPKDILPVEYGGNGGTIPEIIETWNKKIMDHSAFLDEDMQYGTDESKRPGQPRTAEDIIGGIEGSFRQLEFD